MSEQNSNLHDAYTVLGFLILAMSLARSKPQMAAALTAPYIMSVGDGHDLGLQGYKEINK